MIVNPAVSYPSNAHSGLVLKSRIRHGIWSLIFLLVPPSYIIPKLYLLARLLDNQELTVCYFATYS